MKDLFLFSTFKGIFPETHYPRFLQKVSDT